MTAAPLNGRLELTTAPGATITTFTQADIDAGRLVFVHDGAVSTGDSFTFTVSDGAGGAIGATTFTFTVAPFIPPPGGGVGGLVEPEVLEAQVPDQVLDLVRALGPAVVLSRLQYNRLLCR